ncbi:MAG TPA: hypothetical protein VJ837_06425, partial [Candidatus Paceibacterota bacterium]|nr:hypothetical protein [Candidatus Paceibacterota bacterium]
MASTSRSLEGCQPPSRKDAATRISLLADKASFLIGSPQVLDESPDRPVREIFDDAVLDFFGELSRSLLSDTTVCSYLDVVAFALWCRKPELERQRVHY